MKRSWIGALLLGAGMNAHSLGSLANVDIVNRDTGEILKVYRHDGEYWVAGTPGARYAIAIRNVRGGRLLAVTAVDGVNVISGKTASFEQEGYVFNPGEQYDILGWRKSSSEVADFNFTALGDSYAARTGRPANVGVIGVALFMERAPPRQSYAPSPVPPILEGRLQDRVAAQGLAGAAAAPAEKLGTGHGPREVSSVVDVTFERMSAAPNEVIRIRYDRLENLVAMGVVRPPRHGPDALPNAFPDSPRREYVPDPPGGQ